MQDRYNVITSYGYRIDTRSKPAVTLIKGQVGRIFSTFEEALQAAEREIAAKVASVESV